MDLSVYIKFVMALVFVLGLIGALAWAARRFGPGGRLLPNAGKARRLSLVEVMTLDARRRVVLLRHDEREYLLLLGAGQDLLLQDGTAAPAETAVPERPLTDAAA